MRSRSLAVSAALLFAAAGSVSAQIFTEGFEGGTIPGNWIVSNQSNPGPGGTTWNALTVVGANTILPHSGSFFGNCNFNSGSGLSTISNWLLTHEVPLSNGGQFSFWTRTTNGVYPDRLQVRLSTAGGSTNTGTGATAVGDFTTLLLDINPTYSPTGYPTSYQEYTVTLSNIPAGATGRFAFRYFVEGSGPSGLNGDSIGVDDIVYTAGSVQCYANCDSSTTPPILNVADFTCFLQKFAAGDPYANCDASTTPPVLNVADFTCFLQKFAAGCQ